MAGPRDAANGIAPAGVCTPLLLLVLFVAPRTWAGEPGARGGLGDPPSTPEVLPLPDGTLPGAEALPVLPLSQSRVWEEVAQPGGDADLVSLSVSPDSPNRWLAADANGGVYLTDDGGGRWMQVLRGVEAEVRGDEAILLEAEMLSADTFQGVTAADAEAEAEAVRAANETTSAVLESHAASAQVPPTVWFDSAGGGVALIGRAGEVWRSTDGGETWMRVDGEAGAAAFARVGTAVVAGGANGVRASLDAGLSWLDVDSALVGRRVNELTAFGGAFYAATDNGLYRSPDALQWARVHAAPDGPLVSTIPDPDMAGGYWVAAQRGLFRTDDGGLAFSQTVNQPLRGLRKMVHLDGAGHLLAISSDGVWESMDSGIRWTPASRLLSDPDVRALDFSAGEPVIATATGVWRMVQPEHLPDTQAVMRPTMPMGVTVDTALSRAGMQGDLLSLARRTRALPFVPNLQLEFQDAFTGSRDADFQVLTSAGGIKNAWGATAKLCWGCSSSTTYYDYNSDSYDVQQMVDDGALTVIDGQVYDQGSVVAAAANVAQKLASFRVSTAQQISEAWMTRQRLVAETPSLAEAPLRDRVMHELAVQELDARLDCWTDGRFTIWKPESP